VGARDAGDEDAGVAGVESFADVAEEVGLAGLDLDGDDLAGPACFEVDRAAGDRLFVRHLVAAGLEVRPQDAAPVFVDRAGPAFEV
jgi:hypothetical protein